MRLIAAYTDRLNSIVQGDKGYHGLLSLRQPTFDEFGAAIWRTVPHFTISPAERSHVLSPDAAGIKSDDEQLTDLRTAFRLRADTPRLGSLPNNAAAAIHHTRQQPPTMRNPSPIPVGATVQPKGLNNVLGAILITFSIRRGKVGKTRTTRDVLSCVQSSGETLWITYVCTIQNNAAS